MPSVTSEDNSYHCFLFFWLHKQLKSHTWFLTEAAATHGMNSSLNTLWAAASPNLLGVQESWGYRSPFTKNMPKWQGFKFIAGNSPEICYLFWTSLASVPACKAVILK